MKLTDAEELVAHFTLTPCFKDKYSHSISCDSCEKNETCYYLICYKWRAKEDMSWKEDK